MEKYKVGIAGYGVVGQRRKYYIDNHPNLEVVAVCDINNVNTKNISNKINSHTNFVDLLKNELDIIFVCMPNNIAPKVTIESLNKGIHVFCEKPPGRNIRDIEEV